MGGIPNRWLPYSNTGKLIKGTRFVAFKVPLKEALCRNLDLKQRFSPQMLLEQIPGLGLIVDLTNTTRYYNKEEFSKYIEYQKIMCPGKIVPPEDLVKRFYNIIDSFIRSHPNDGSLIGVHCTHGLNRTSYFICRYMIEIMGFEPRNAIAEFEIARGHRIEREEYKRTLLRCNKGLVRNSSSVSGGESSNWCQCPSQPYANSTKILEKETSNWHQCPSQAYANSTKVSEKETSSRYQYPATNFQPAQITNKSNVKKHNTSLKADESQRRDRIHLNGGRKHVVSNFARPESRFYENSNSQWNSGFNGYAGRYQRGGPSYYSAQIPQSFTNECKWDRTSENSRYNYRSSERRKKYTQKGSHIYFD